MRGAPVANMIGFGIFMLFFVAMIGAAVWYGEAPRWFGWLMIIPLVTGSLWLFVWAALCISRHVYWSFEANDEKIHWFRSDRRGVIRERKEVAVADVVEIWRSRGSSDIPGGLYLKLRSGDCVDIGGVAQPESSFLEWVSINLPGVNLKIE
jgi:hypothetical protein